MDTCSEHYPSWNLIILDYFLLSFVSQNFKFFLDVFCMDLVKENALHISLCMSILPKCEMKGLLYTERNVSESTK